MNAPTPQLDQGLALSLSELWLHRALPGLESPFWSMGLSDGRDRTSGQVGILEEETCWMAGSLGNKSGTLFYG